MACISKPLLALDNRLSDGQSVQLRYPTNQAYLRGEAPAAYLGNNSKGWWWFGRVSKGVLLTVLVLFVTYSSYLLLWNSSLAIRTESTSLRVAGPRTLSYSYQVKGEMYEKIEPTYDVWKTRWQQGEGSEAIRYLSFWPEHAKLSFNIEPLRWWDVFMVAGFLSVLAYAGHITMRTQQRLESLACQSSHLLLGRVVQVVKSQGFRYVIYTTNSPVNGEAIRGSITVGEAEKVKNSLLEGTAVAVFYKDDTNHSLL